MQCSECGANLPGKETCLDRFHALLGAEYFSEEAAQMHGLTVLTFHLQHPSLTKPWYQVGGYDAMRRIFGAGREKEWLQVLYEMRQGSFRRFKASVGPSMPPEIVTRPVPGEMTVADLDPSVPPGHAARVLDWARSVAQGRVLFRHGTTGRAR